VGEVGTFVANATITSGRAVQLVGDATNGLRVEHASDVSARAVIGVAIEAGTAGNNIQVLLRGVYRTSTTLTANGLVYVGDTSGGLTTTVPATSGDYVRIVGVAGNSNTVFVNPQFNYVQVA
jgi:hypothetical protein